MGSNLQEIMNKYNFGDSPLFFSPKIPENKLKNAIAAYAQTESCNDVILLLDDTVFGGAKDGLLLTRKGLYLHEIFSEALFIKLEDIDEIWVKNKDIYVNKTKSFTCNIFSKQHISMLSSLLSELVAALQDGNARDSHEIEEEQMNPTNRVSSLQEQKHDSSTKTEKMAEGMISSNVVGNKFDDDKILTIIKKYNFNDEKIYFAPKIPDNKLKNAIAAYASSIRPNDVLALLDDTVWGGAKEGALLSREKIFFHELFSEPIAVNLSDIEDIATKGKRLGINGKTVFRTTNVDEKYLLGFANMLREIAEECSAATLDEATIITRRLFQEVKSRDEHFFRKLFYQSGVRRLTEAGAIEAHELLKLAFILSKKVSDHMPNNKPASWLAYGDSVVHELIIYLLFRGLFLIDQAFINNDICTPLKQVFAALMEEKIFIPFYKLITSKKSGTSALKTAALQMNYEKYLESVISHRTRRYSLFDFTNLKALANQLSQLIYHSLIGNLGKCNLEGLLHEKYEVHEENAHLNIINFEAALYDPESYPDEVNDPMFLLYKTCYAVYNVISDELGPFLNQLDALLEEMISKFLLPQLKAALK